MPLVRPTRVHSVSLVMSLLFCQTKVSVFSTSTVFQLCLPKATEAGCGWLYHVVCRVAINSLGGTLSENLETAQQALPPPNSPKLEDRSPLPLGSCVKTKVFFLGSIPRSWLSPSPGTHPATDAHFSPGEEVCSSSFF